MDITLAHAEDLNRRDPPTTSLHRLPDPGPFSLTGGYKTTQASTVSQQLVVTYLNVGGLTAHKLDFILAYMQKTNTDVLICSDARLTDKAGRRLEKRTKSILGPFSRVHYTALSKDARTRRTPSCPLVGGFFCIVNERWGPSLLTCKSDRTGLGVLTCLPLRTADGTISILGTYWPIPYTEASVEDHPGSFWAQIQSWCHRNDIDKSPIDYVRDLSLAWLNTELKNGSIAAIYGGDLNAIWSAGEQGGSYVLGPWAEEHGFINGPVQIAQHRKERFHTHQSGSWLDHILHMGALGHIDILGAHVSTGVEWKGISDHRPITAQYRVARPSTKPPVLATTPSKRPELDRSDPRATADFDELLRKYMENHPCNVTSPEEANEYLFRLERATVKIVRRINQHYGKDKKRSPRKDGWSPQYAAMKIHLQTLLHIRRHTLGHHKYHQWRSPEEACTGIAQLADLWIARTDSLSIPGNNLDAIRHVTGLGPHYWKHLTRPPAGHDLDTEINLLQSRMHGRLRTDMRSSISYHCAKRETLRELGKTKLVLKSILGRMGGRKHQDPLFLGAVRESDTLVDVTPTDFFRYWLLYPGNFDDEFLHGLWIKWTTD